MIKKSLVFAFGFMMPLFIFGFIVFLTWLGDKSILLFVGFMLLLWCFCCGMAALEYYKFLR